METIHLSFFLLLCFGVCRSTSTLLQRQKRNWIIDSFSIDEGYDGPFPYSLGHIKIEKNLTLFKIHGQGVNEEPKDVLSINEDTGEVTVHRAVDYEKVRVLKPTFQALDRKNNIIDTQLSIEITIQDANDNAPQFSQKIYSIVLQESTSQGTTIITVMASDIDIEENGRFDFEIVSVTPKPQDLLFYLSSRVENAQSISFKGCLDHETADKYTITMKVQDHGRPKQLSSTCTVEINISDGNNHHPEITGHTGPGRIKEGVENVVVSRLQVTDKDVKETAAWRVNYHIEGDTEDNFEIITDNKTNEGLLYVKKSLDYEESSQKNLRISVKNEIPYHTCRVVNRRQSGLWEVATSRGTETRVSFYSLTVTVEDVNDPPVFDKAIKKVSVNENMKAGQYLETFTATDPDVSSANTIVYRMGDDPAGWITVDHVTGRVTTSKMIDRESSYVKDDIYMVTVYAIDNGKPPSTATATLSIHVVDKNDNAPYLSITSIDMCQSDRDSLANVTVVDLDKDPYGGPFSFKLLNADSKWKVNHGKGYSAILTKGNTVPSGHFELSLEVTDNQGDITVLKLSVTVCKCSDPARPNCRSRKAPSITTGAAFWIIFVTVLLLTGVLLALLWKCGEQRQAIGKEIEHDGFEQHLMGSGDTETPGTDCKVDLDSFKFGHREQTRKVLGPSVTIKTTEGSSQEVVSYFNIMEQERRKREYLRRLISGSVQDGHSERFLVRKNNSMETKFTQETALHSSMSRSSTITTRQMQEQRMRRILERRNKYKVDQEFDEIRHTLLLTASINQILCNLQVPEKELCDYDPHVYANEEDTETYLELDAISIPDTDFDIDFNLDLDLDVVLKFNTLVSICLPKGSAAYRTTSCVMKELEATTLIQVENHRTDKYVTIVT